ncbi:hypothetical protein J4210_05315 [Candidatus Woesearchaeota archaeon]|nr:hypothetical protein [Candidatus Woesearchaeota archaeon]
MTDRLKTETWLYADCYNALVYDDVLLDLPVGHELYIETSKAQVQNGLPPCGVYVVKTRHDQLTVNSDSGDPFRRVSVDTLVREYFLDHQKTKDE